MDFTRFKTLCEDKNTTPTALAIRLGINRSNPTTWKNGGNPSIEVLLKIADELECSIDYLYGRDEYVGNNQISLTGERIELLKLWDNLDDSSKIIVKAKAIEELRRIER